VELLGLGTQILDCLRVRKLIDAHAETFLLTVYTAAEINFCKERTHSTEYYAAVWAAKEAVFRSLGTKWRRGASWHDVEIICTSTIEPSVVVTGPTQFLMTQRGVTAIRISFAYTRLYATATAIALRS
jgi:holo-[acyl-carrier protein] synthase